MFFKSLKKEILVFTIGLIIVTIFITMALAAYSTQTAGRAAENATSDVLREQAKESLVQIVTLAADQQDLLFERVRDDASNVASYVKNIYENPSLFARNAYWEFDTRVFQKNGRYVNNESDISTIHLPSFVTLDANEKRNIERSAYLDFIAPSILKHNPNIAAVWTVDAKGVTRYFPNIILGNIAPPDYDPREDVFYKPATPQENSQKNVVWSPLYDDPAGRGLMITATAPIYTKNGFAGVVGIDMLLKSIITTITAYSPIEKSYAFLIDKKGITIAFPDKAYKDILGRSRKEGEVQTDLAESNEEFSRILQEMTNGSTGFGSMQNKNDGLFMAYAPLKQTGFSMATVAEKNVMLKATSVLGGEILHSVQNMIVNRILPASVLIIFFASIISVLLVTQIVKPIRELTLGAHEIGKGNLKYKLNVNSLNEIGDLASSFTQMSKDLRESREKLYEYSQGLEERIKERTQELEQNNVRLRHLTAELEIANQELKNLDQTKTEFMSIASHQLRTPLTLIKGYLSLAREGTLGDISPKAKDALAKIANSADQLIKLINDLLNFTRMETGKIEYTFAINNITIIIKEVIAELKPQADEKKLIIRIEPKDNIEQFLFDRNKIREVMINLLHNAIKYTQNGTIIVRQQVIGRDDKEFVRISVHDNGIGIAKEDVHRLFAKFVRTKEAKIIDVNGLGLGLFFIKKVVEDHGGRAWAESEGLDKGSTFIIEIPFKI